MPLVNQSGCNLPSESLDLWWRRRIQRLQRKRTMQKSICKRRRRQMMLSAHAELPKWFPSIQAEYTSLTQEFRAVRTISDKKFEDVMKDPEIQYELVPGGAIFTVDEGSGVWKLPDVGSTNPRGQVRIGNQCRGHQDVGPICRSSWSSDRCFRHKDRFSPCPSASPNQETVII